MCYESPVRAWDLTQIEAVGTRDPVVLDSHEAGRAVLVAIAPGQELGDHQVKERAWVVVVEGRVRVSTGGEAHDCAPGTLLQFDRDERRAIASEGGARVLMLFAPWPAADHYVGDKGP